MVTFLWIICRLLFLGIGVILVISLLRSIHWQEIGQILKNGFLNGLKGSGFQSRQGRYHVELYQWVTCDDDDVCDDCQERADWPPMDIADWMKAGLPGTPEAHTQCCRSGQKHEHSHCRCKLVLVKSKQSIPF